ncbi:exopolysaccharide biosynthesis polyprenyl glycosylphosphotransferase [Streptomyces sp. DH37]|uniref:exopolysaccharide biosynthesis polyprenyl glycosylphosphotransferase n=1 Tax=Streptomyces sp. DH37 TaxID=3040122 RepID=UPI0024429B89|nr:exopolysaccharide biosynthesis polyprenyl glycosylphosphotransferase [Streptomyces sp. DH37]MDG9704676.1 exopolysaccharide biosynthesis polyprenyl glycosylphosphotransferase [Streptomyces sp. DH37]
MTTENTGTSNPSRVLPLPEPMTRTTATHPGPPRGPAHRSLPPPLRGNPYRRRAAGLLMAADCLAAIATAVAVAGPDGGGGRDAFTTAVLCAVLLAVLVPLNARGGLYRVALAPSALGELPALLGRTAIAWCAAAALPAAARDGQAQGWAALAVAVAGHTALACAARGAVHLARRRAGRRRPRSALVVGAGPAGRRITTALYEHPEYGMRPVGVAEPGGEPADAALAEGVSVPVLTGREDIARAVIQNAVRDAVFTRDPWSDPETAALVPLFDDLDCTVWVVGATSPAAHPATAPHVRGDDHLWGFACRRLDPRPRRGPAGLRCKRALDVTVAAAALVAVAPVLLACALAVRIADGPGVIFRQERIGLGGRPFTVLKFRTLRPRDEHESATRWNVAEDRRMSRVGHVLRRTSLDELPQLWNVLRGDMSLVGPRPERPYFVQRFSQLHPGYAARHRMPAGITGLAQVHGLRGDTSIEDRARFDNHYIDTWSLWQDVRILLHTAGSVFRLGGS